MASVLESGWCGIETTGRERRLLSEIAKLACELEKVSCSESSRLALHLHDVYGQELLQVKMCGQPSVTEQELRDILEAEGIDF